MIIINRGKTLQPVNKVYMFLFTCHNCITYNFSDIPKYEKKNTSGNTISQSGNFYPQLTGNFALLTESR